MPTETIDATAAYRFAVADLVRARAMLVNVNEAILTTQDQIAALRAEAPKAVVEPMPPADPLTAAEQSFESARAQQIEATKAIATAEEVVQAARNAVTHPFVVAAFDDANDPDRSRDSEYIRDHIDAAAELMFERLKAQPADSLLHQFLTDEFIRKGCCEAMVMVEWRGR